jgi:hypothetical protein
MSKKQSGAVLNTLLSDMFWQSARHKKTVIADLPQFLTGW